MVARYYDSGIGRFISQDSAYLLLGDSTFEQRYERKLQQHLSDPQQLNSYSYVANNPLKHTDETGEIAPLFVAGIYLLWQAAEAGLSAYDAYSTYQTVTNPSASFGEKLGSVGLFGLGLVGPGGGYKTIASKADNAGKFLRGTDNSRNVGRHIIKAGDNIAGLRVTEHAAEQFAKRNFPIEQVKSALKEGTKYIDNKTGNLLHVVGERGKGGYTIISDTAQKTLVTVQNFVQKLPESRYKKLSK